MFEILLDIPAQKSLKKFDRKTALRIIESIGKLAEDPIPVDAPKRKVSYATLFKRPVKCFAGYIYDNGYL
ncbi:MAG: hypothetical protein C5S46_02615 [Candidatus Methanomarinus sp.]|uniref:Uncharacterized protein n=1 Tax=Candidatus Methanomarinus sp. TaxID=3386244 RepID=A0AC61SBI6_9EURY|nr:MAG: hypothetical protein C5S46_02615 [ANME-2 cluster archaeon]